MKASKKICIAILSVLALTACAVGGHPEHDFSAGSGDAAGSYL